MNWYLEVLQKYAVFTGRARRTEYWMFTLINFIISVVLSVVDTAAGMPGVLSGLYALAVLIPSLAVFVRRLHDTGRSGFWFFIILIPLIGAIVLLVFLVQDSTPGPNQHGPNPKGE